MQDACGNDPAPVSNSKSRVRTILMPDQNRLTFVRVI